MAKQKRWSDADKTKIVAEYMLGGATRAVVAKKYGCNPNQIYDWGRSLTNTKRKQKSVLNELAEANASVQPAHKSPLETENEMLWGIVRRQIREGKLSLR